MIAGNLKAYTANVTTETGHTIQIYISCERVLIEPTSQTIALTFCGFASDEIRQCYVEAVQNKTQPTVKWFNYVLVVPAERFMEIFLQSVNGLFGFVISDNGWQIAQTIPFIPNYRLEDGKMIQELKSLADLGAVEILIPVYIPD
jgi:hypothetical protein